MKIRYALLLAKNTSGPTKIIIVCKKYNPIGCHFLTAQPSVLMVSGLL